MYMFIIGGLYFDAVLLACDYANWEVDLEMRVHVYSD